IISPLSAPCVNLAGPPDRPPEPPRDRRAHLPVRATLEGACPSAYHHVGVRGFARPLPGRAPSGSGLYRSSITYPYRDVRTFPPAGRRRGGERTCLNGNARATRRDRNAPGRPDRPAAPATRGRRPRGVQQAAAARVRRAAPSRGPASTSLEW